MRYFAPAVTVLAASGRHAERYLQARLSNDVRLCTATRAIPAAALTPQGRTEAFGWVWRDPAGSFYLELDGATSAELLTAIGRFKVAEQVDIGLAPLQVVHIIGRSAEEIPRGILGFTPPTTVSGAITTGVTENGFAAMLRRARTPETGIDIIAPAPVLERLIAELCAAGATEIPPAEQEALRLEGGFPLFPRDLNDTVILAEAGLPDTVSFTKGCYTGQEVIAKIDSLGKPPRLLTRLVATGEHPVAAETPVMLDGKPIGKVTSAAFHATRGVTLLYALLKNDGAPRTAPLTVGGTPFSPL